MTITSCNKCGGSDFFVEVNGNNTGLYCQCCGKWQKWLTKDEIRLYDHGLLKPKDDSSERKQLMLDYLKNDSEQVLELAYLYAKNYHDYGVDVTKAFDTAVVQSAALHDAYLRGCVETEQRLRMGVNERAIKVSTVKTPHTYMKAVGPHELEKLLSDGIRHEDKI